MRDFILGSSKITADGDCSHEIERCLLPGRKAMTILDSILKKHRHYFADKSLSSQSYGFSSGHVPSLSAARGRRRPRPRRRRLLLPEGATGGRRWFTEPPGRALDS